MKKIFIFLSMVIITCVCFAVFNKVSYSNDDLGTKTYKKEEKVDDKNTNTNNSKRVRQDTIDKEKTEQPNEEKTNKKTYTQIKTVSFSEFEKLVADGNSFVVIISSSACSHCLNYEPIVNKVLKDLNETIYRLDILSMTVPDKNKLNEYFTISGTPTLLAFSNKIVVKALEGEKTDSEFKDWYRKALV